MDFCLVKGDVVEGYEVVDEGRHGTTACVYRVRLSGKDYALKLYTGSFDDKKRFIREGEYMSQFSHLNIVKIIKRGEYEITRGVKLPFIIMEYVDGYNLKDFYSWYVGTYGQFPVDLAIELIQQVALALNYVIRGFNIIHRDLKLENILVTRESHQCKIIDFGLANRLGDSKLSSSWEFNAAPRYRAPERWRDFHATEEKSDVWSLGIILYYLLTGKLPFETAHDTGAESKLMEMIQYDEPQPPSDSNPNITKFLDLLIAVMLSKTESSRPNFSELISILDRGKEMLPISIENMYTNRAKALGQLRFNPEEDRRFTRDKDYIGMLYNEEYRRSTVETFRRARILAFKRFIEAPVKWGPSFSSQGQRVANVCEILLAADDNIIRSTGSITILEEAISWLIAQERGGGFPSLSHKLVTIQCTALAAIAFHHISTLSSFPVNIRDRAHDTSIRACQACVELAGEQGWGTWGKGTIRLQPTIWALHALICHYKEFQTEIMYRFNQLRVMHSDRSHGCFGFQPGTKPQISPTACFLLISSKLDSAGYQPVDRKQYSLEKHQAKQFLLTVLHKREVKFWESEHEVYYVDQNIVPLVGGIEQMSWNHISGPLAIEALVHNTALMSSEEIITWFLSAIELYRRFSPTGLWEDPVLLQAGMQDPIFPTTYACIAMRAVEVWLESFNGLVNASFTP